MRFIGTTSSFVIPLSRIILGSILKRDTPDTPEAAWQFSMHVY